MEHYQPPKLKGKAVVHGQGKAVIHGHCHHKVIMKMGDEEAVLSKLGLDSGCCGMAGAFGFEKDHYNLSIKAGERVFLPAVRSADKEALIIADGFSCREQIEQTTDRKALHLAQVIQMALHEGKNRPSGKYPETAYVKSPVPSLSSRLRTVAIAGTGLALVGGAAAWILKLARSAGREDRG